MTPKDFATKNATFRSSESANFVKNVTTNPEFSHVFCHPKMRPIEQCITVTAVNLFYDIQPKQFEAFGFYFYPGKIT